MCCGIKSASRVPDTFPEAVERARLTSGELSRVFVLQRRCIGILYQGLLISRFQGLIAREMLCSTGLCLSWTCFGYSY